MKEKKDLKEIVKEKYSQIANQSKSQNETSCCGATGCCSSVDYSIFSESYYHIDGYNPDADLGLGCGLPTEFANIKKGDYVLDLGSGAGNDCFVASAIVGETGRVTGIDFTDEMLIKAKLNAEKLKISNVEFVKGDIENMPLNNNIFDVVISNCVLNLVPDKRKAFMEIYRILKNNGHFCISDVVLQGNLPNKLQKDAEMYAGCVSGALQIDDYLNEIKTAGFTNIEIKKKKEISIPIELLQNYLSKDEINNYSAQKIGIFSITVFATK